jgi:V/A-type H+-transporting ATPase subunit E
MEELRSTEILDREIEYDARKKAERLLVNADAECAKILAEVDTRIEKMRDEKKAVYSEQIEHFRRNADAALPLEQVRFLVSFEGNSVVAAINDYLKALSDDKRLSIIAKMISAHKAIFAGKTIEISAVGIKADTAKKLVKDNLDVSILSCKEVPTENTGDEELAGITMHEGVIVETDDGSIRMRATLDERVSEILDKHRSELAGALFGRRIPE